MYLKFIHSLVEGFAVTGRNLYFFKQAVNNDGGMLNGDNYHFW